MKKTFTMSDLGCANCAAKMENEISKLDGVNSANVNFIMQKITIDADDAEFDKIVKKANKICRRIEPDCEIDF